MREENINNSARAARENLIKSKIRRREMKMK
jgi:hypothetical protein